MRTPSNFSSFIIQLSSNKSKYIEGFKISFPFVSPKPPSYTKDTLQKNTNTNTNSTSTHYIIVYKPIFHTFIDFYLANLNHTTYNNIYKNINSIKESIHKTMFFILRSNRLQLVSSTISLLLPYSTSYKIISHNPKSPLLSTRSFKTYSTPSSFHLYHHPLFQILPIISIHGSNLQIDDLEFNFKAHPLVLRLIKTFLKSKNNFSVSREDLIRGVYLEESYSKLTHSSIQCFQSTLLQLIARARNLLNELLGIYYKIDWFYYDTNTQLWTLYTIDLSFIRYKSRYLLKEFDSRI